LLRLQQVSSHAYCAANTEEYQGKETYEWQFFWKICSFVSLNKQHPPILSHLKADFLAGIIFPAFFNSLLTTSSTEYKATVLVCA
jgi:hypothetical protein